MFMGKKAQSIMEYAIVLGLVSIVFVTMNIYVKRNVQGKVKDLTDFFIAPSSEHISDPSPSGQTDSDIRTQFSSTAQSLGTRGGGKRQTVDEVTGTPEGVPNYIHTVDNGIPIR